PFLHDTTLKVDFGYRFAPNLAVSGGPTLNIMVTDSGLSPSDLSYTAGSYELVGQEVPDNDAGKVVTTIWPGFAVGVHF
ncbi:MAG: hypothetical protein AAFX99_26810, partial [Myxococcota bacterium]